MPRTGPPPPTLAELRRDTCWLWLACNGCRRFEPVTLVPLIIRWGRDASTDRLRQSARCSRCGTRGAALQMPSWTGSATGFQTFADALLRVAALDRLKAETKQPPALGGAEG